MSEVAEFRSDVSAWIADNCPDGAKGPGQLANGSTKIELEKDVAIWLERCAEKGFTAPTWPTEFGGGGLSAELAKVLFEEMGKANARTPLTGMGMTMIGPTLLEYGSAEQKARHLKGIASGEIRWCLGLSEPNAGSDLASLSTKAEDKGDYFALNGQKVWTSNARDAAFGMLLVRPDVDVPKHRGITYLILDMATPGIDIRPLKQPTGRSEFNEVFLDDVRVPVSNRIGDEGAGFMYQMLQFQEERLWAGANSLVGLENIIKWTIEYTRQRTAFKKSILDNQVVHFRLAELSTEIEALRALVYRATELHIAGENVTRLASMAKLKCGRLSREVADSCLQYWGGMGFMWETQIAKCYANSRVTTIYAGTNEIMKELIARKITRD